MPVGFWALDWQSANLNYDILRLLTEEVLGYQTEETGRSIIVVSGLWAIAGCRVPVALEREAMEQCELDPARAVSTTHLTVETWDFYLPTTLQELDQRHPERQPIKLGGDFGSLGFRGQAANWVPREVWLDGLKDGIVLDHFRSYNDSMFFPAKYFDSIDHINTTEFFRDASRCRDYPPMNQDKDARDYLRHFNDHEGLESYTEDGVTKLRGRCDDGVWWLSPACRRNRTRCIPWITIDGYGYSVIWHKVVEFNMPLALASTTNWVNVIHQNRVLNYAWIPDAQFVNRNLMQVLFPGYSKEQHDQSLFITEFAQVVTEKWAHRGLEQAAPRLWATASSMNLTRTKMQEVLEDRELTGKTSREAACHFLRNNEEIWRGWIPDVTSCFDGQGLVEEGGERKCDWCPRATASRPHRRIPGSRECIPCPKGTYQPLAMQNDCLPCEEGTYADRNGSETCSLCEQGKFTDQTASSECRTCPPMRTTKVEGARSVSFCFCQEGHYEPSGLGPDDYTCEVCAEQLECPVDSRMSVWTQALSGNWTGSTAEIYPRVAPAFYADAADPQKVFKCRSEEECPGGAFNTCGPNRGIPPEKVSDSTGLVCAKCLQGYHQSFGGDCIKCQTFELGYFLMPTLQILFAPVLCVIIYMLSKDPFTSAEACRALCARRAEEDAALAREAEELRVEAAERLRVPEREGKPPQPADVLRLNVGGDPSFATTRKTLTCLGHSRLAELFSGRWDSALPRDEQGRIFLDFDPAQFRALLDWLGDVCRTGPSASLPDPEESLPPDLRWGFGALCSLLGLSPPSAGGAVPAPAAAGRPPATGPARQEELEEVDAPDAVEDAAPMVVPEGSLLTPALGVHLSRMLGTPSEPKKLVPLHRASRDGFTAAAFHAHCDGQVRTVTVAQSAGGYIFGGYSGAATWGNQGQWAPSEGTFLFRLAGPGVQAPSKHPLVHNLGHAIYCHGGHGPTFGAGHDLYIQNSAGTSGTLTSNLGATYSQQAEGGGVVLTSLAESSSTTITDWEVFSVQPQPSVDGLLREALLVPGELPECRRVLEQVRAALSVAQAGGLTQKRRRQDIASKRAHLERDVEFMKKFIDTPGSEHQIVRLNVSGRAISTMRSTLTQCAGSLLASKFGPRWSVQDDDIVDGGVFFDLSPALFGRILQFLRLKRLWGDSLEISAPPVPKESICAFDRLLDYLSMREYVPLAILDSSLLSHEHFATLQAWLLAGTRELKQARLLHRASRDGFTAAAFHAHCDGQPHTLTVARSAGGFLFGGYTGSAAWTSQGQYTASEGAFLFRLAGPGVNVPSKHPLAQNPWNAVYSPGGYGPTFGGGHDLCIQNSTEARVTVTSNLGHTYSQQAEGASVSLTTLAESNSFDVAEWEVFALAATAAL